MKRIWINNLLLCFVISYSTNTFAADCGQYLQKASLVAAGEGIFTPESAPTVRELLSHLKKLTNEQIQPKELSIIYQAIQPQINEALEYGSQLEVQGYPLRQTAAFVQRFSKIVELPIEYINKVAHWGSGGCSNRIHDFEIEFYQNATQLYQERFGRDHLADYLPKFISHHFEESIEQTPQNLDRDFFIEGISSEIAERKRFFQYTYIYRVGEVSLLDFIRIRETGASFIGIKKETNGYHDGQHGSAADFEEHDYFHAYFQKVRDQELFDSLGVKNIEDARRLQTLNQQQVDLLLAEWDLISDRGLKTTIEVMLFALMHEQAVSYPTQVLAELENPSRLDFYQRVGKSTIPRGVFGEDIKKLLQGSVDSTVDSALEWIKVRAKSANARVLNQFYK